MRKLMLGAMLAPVCPYLNAATERYRAAANSIACDDKPTMIQFVKAIRADQVDLALAAVNRARSNGVSCTIVEENKFVAGMPSGFGLIYLPDGEYYSAIDGFDLGLRLSMKGGWKCREPTEFDREIGHRQATNRDLDLTLTRIKHSLQDTLTLSIFVRPPNWLSENSPESISLKVDNGKVHTIEVYHPEVRLSKEIANELKRGMNVSIAIRSEEGNVYRTSAQLIGFTAAYNCVMGPT